MDLSGIHLFREKITMKKLIILFLMITPFITADLLAYRGPRRGLNKGYRQYHEGICFGDESYLKERLSLSDKQISSIGRINAAYKKALWDFQEKIQPKRLALRKLLLVEEIDLQRVRSLLKEIADLEVEIRMLRIQHRLDIEKVLTKEQRDRLRRERRMKRPPRRIWD